MLVYARFLHALSHVFFLTEASLVVSALVYCFDCCELGCQYQCNWLCGKTCLQMIHCVLRGMLNQTHSFTALYFEILSILHSFKNCFNTVHLPQSKTRTYLSVKKYYFWSIFLFWQNVQNGSVTSYSEHTVRITLNTSTTLTCCQWQRRSWKHRRQNHRIHKQTVDLLSWQSYTAPM